jgi:hypothetical protein
MTAINPARLKIQCAELAQSYADPELFIPQLHELFGFYSHRIRQAGVTRRPQLIQSYQVVPPIMRALERALLEPLLDQPPQGLILIDALWEEEWVETRVLAAVLLGHLPINDPDSIFLRLRSWLGSNKSDTIREIIITRGIYRSSLEEPQLVLDFFQDLLLTPKKEHCQAVLFGVLPFIEDQGFTNLPLIYKLLGDILLDEEKGLIKEILEVLKTLMKRSEGETLYFLEKQLAVAAKPRIIRIVRQILPGFSDHNQRTLKEALERYSQ